MFLTKGQLRLYLGALLILQLLTCATLFQGTRAGMTDFRTYYTAGHMIRDGNPLYDYQAEVVAQSAWSVQTPTHCPSCLFPTPHFSSSHSHLAATSRATSSSLP